MSVLKWAASPRFVSLFWQNTEDRPHRSCITTVTELQVLSVVCAEDHAGAGARHTLINRSPFRRKVACLIRKNDSRESKSAR